MSEGPSSLDSQDEESELEGAQSVAPGSATDEGVEETGGRAGLKRKTEVGPTPPLKKRTKKCKGLPPGQSL